MFVRLFGKIVHRGNAKVFFVLPIESGVAFVRAHIRHLRRHNARTNQRLCVEDFFAVDVLRRARVQMLLKQVRDMRFAEIKGF